MSYRVVEKVTAFVTRLHNQRPELLVLRHPLAGLQLPAGTVGIYESFEQAVLREVAEETGLQDLEIESYLGSEETILSGDDRVILLMTKLFSSPAYDSSSAGYVVDRGLTVRVTECIGKFSAILCDPLDHQDPPMRHHGVSGFVRSGLLGEHILRHMFQLRSTLRTPNEWQIQADGHLFDLHWIQLDPLPRLHPNQSGWLDSYSDTLFDNGSLSKESSD